MIPALEQKMVVYCIRNNIDGKRYIGQTVKYLKVRWGEHNQKNQTGCRALHRALMKYGKDNFTVSVLSRCANMEEMNHREQYYIKLFNTLAPNGYNLTTGGKNRKVSEETKKRISLAKKNQPVSDSMRLAREKLKGRIPHNKGKKMSEEQRAKLIGRVHSAETREKIAKAHVGKKVSLERKKALTDMLNESRKVRKVVDTSTGEIFDSIEDAERKKDYKSGYLDYYLHGNNKRVNHTNIYYVDDPRLTDPLWTEKMKMQAEASLARSFNKKPVVCLELGRQFSSAAEAARILGIVGNKITLVCQGKRKHTHGYSFIYA